MQDAVVIHFIESMFVHEESLQRKITVRTMECIEVK